MHVRLAPENTLTEVVRMQFRQLLSWALFARKAHEKLLSPGALDWPTTESQLRESELFKSWWYYTVELMPGVTARGNYPDDLPMLPRLLLKNCRLEGMDCLDIGSMEGLIPVLMRRQGATRVVATDAYAHCAEKMAAIQHYYDVDFEFCGVGLLYDLHGTFPNQGFDLINLSGVLYHVFSPLLVLSGIRSLLKKDGLMIVSTNVVCDDSYCMEFNNAGRLQEEANTFWYVSINALDYLLRYLKLAPIDCVYLPHESINWSAIRLTDKPTGYLSLVCKAVDDVLPTAGDHWMRQSANNSWEHQTLPNWARGDSQPRSTIGYRQNQGKENFRPEFDALNLLKAAQSQPPLADGVRRQYSHILRLSDQA
jgi:2-polyprenyl-3-methyl-5-hydroxy-6-metoxy-1,4-benzoquinol methylase